MNDRTASGRDTDRRAGCVQGCTGATAQGRTPGEASERLEDAVRIPLAAKRGLAGREDGCGEVLREGTALSGPPSCPGNVLAARASSPRLRSTTVTYPTRTGSTA